MSLVASEDNIDFVTGDRQVLAGLSPGTDSDITALSTLGSIARIGTKVARFNKLVLSTVQ